MVLEERPFLEHWDYLWSLEVRRKQGEFGGSGMKMILQFMQDISYEEFLKHAKRTTAVLEIAKYYENPLCSTQDVVDLTRSIQKNFHHSESFVYAVYFAAWIKSEVAESKRAFKSCDRDIELSIREGGSIQLMLRDIIRNHISFEAFSDTFKSSNVNGIYKFLESKKILSSDDFDKLDDIEARHLMDQIVMYSSLQEMRLH